MAPEAHSIDPDALGQLTGKAAGKASDMWALGVCIYVLAVGRMPFWSHNVLKLADMIENWEPPFPLTLPAGLVALLKGLLCKNPTERLSCQAAMQNDWVTYGGTKQVDSGRHSTKIEKIVVTQHDVDRALFTSQRWVWMVMMKVKMHRWLLAARRNIAERKRIEAGGSPRPDPPPKPAAPPTTAAAADAPAGAEGGGEECGKEDDGEPDVVALRRREEENGTLGSAWTSP